MEENACQTTPEELKAQHRRCWSPNCRGKAFLRDGFGWQWCFRHWKRGLYDSRPTLKHKWGYIKYTRFF